MVEVKILCIRCRRKVPSDHINPESIGGCRLCRKPDNEEHAPRHRYDCGRCKFSWSCGLACGCNLKRGKHDAPPEEVKLDRLHAFLNCGTFIKDKNDLDRYIEGIWKDD